MKIYLAGPMKGMHDMNTQAFDAQAAKLRELGHTVYNPADLVRKEVPMREAMAMEVDWICREAEAIALMFGWQRSAGSRAEKALAGALGLWVLEL